MAQYTFTLKAVDSTYIDHTHPNTNFNNADTGIISGDIRTSAEIIVKFSPIPENMRKKRLLSTNLHTRYKSESDTKFILFAINPVNLKTITYNNEDIKRIVSLCNPENDLPSSNVYRWATVYSDTINDSYHIDKIKKFFDSGYALFSPTSSATYVYLNLVPSGYAPYIDFVAEDFVTSVIDCSPQSGFIDDHQANTFRWNITQTTSADVIGQRSAIFRWRETGQTTINTINVSGSKTEITVPANTFTGDSIQWQVQVTSDDGIVSNPSDWFTLTTVDSIPVSTSLSPVDAYVDGSRDAVFRWRHTISTGTPQSRYELQYSSDSGQNWIDLSSADTAQTIAVIPADTLPAARLIWRVRTYNSDGVAGSWSSPANIIVRAAPPQPVLGVSQVSPRPLFTWQSTGQSSWKLAVLQNGEEIYNTGEVPGDDKRFRMLEYLPNGSYEARLWVNNLYELQSQAAVVSFAIAMEEVPSPELEVQAKENKALLSISADGFSKYYIFRDGVMVHKMDMPGVWEDYTACGNHTYWVRGVMSDDAFADSNRVRVWVPVLFAQISDTEDLAHPIPLKFRRGEYPLLEGEIMPQGKSTFFAGRQYPLYEFAENLSEPLSMRFSYRDREDFEKLVQIVKGRRAILYRDYRGERRYLAVTGINYTVDAVSWDFSLSTERVDYVEAIAYDPPEEA